MKRLVAVAVLVLVSSAPAAAKKLSPIKFPDPGNRVCEVLFYDSAARRLGFVGAGSSGNMCVESTGDLDFDFSGGTLGLPSSATLPATCEPPEVYLDSSAPSGQWFYACEATDTWVLQGGVGGGSVNAEEDNVLVVTAAPAFDFGGGFDVVPDGGEADVSLDTTEAPLSALEESAEIDGDIAAHAGLPNAHHIPTASYTHPDPINLGGASLSSYLVIPNGASPTVDAAGEIAEDTTDGQLLLGANGYPVAQPVKSACMVVNNLAAADDDVPFPVRSGQAIELVSGFCHCQGTCTTEADLTFEYVQVGTAGPTVSAVTGTLTCEDYVAGDTSVTFSGNTSVEALDVLRFDTGAGVDPETDTYSICVNYRLGAT